MASKASVDVIKKKDVVEVLDEKPDYLQNMESQGPLKSQDNFDSTDIAVPRIKLLQGTSEECETFDDAKPGLFWHTGMDISLGTSFEFIVCNRRKKYLLTPPLNDKRGVFARSEDAVTWDRTGKWDVELKGGIKVTWEITDLNAKKSGLLEWGTYNPNDPDSPPAATLFYDYLILLPSYLDLGPAVVSLTRSQIRKAKKGLNDKIELHTNNGRPMQAVVFDASSVKDTNADGEDYKNWQFRSGGFASEALYKRANEVSTLLADFRVKDEDQVMKDESQTTAQSESKDF